MERIVLRRIEMLTTHYKMLKTRISVNPMLLLFHIYEYATVSTRIAAIGVLFRRFLNPRCFCEDADAGPHRQVSRFR